MTRKPMTKIVEPEIQLLSFDAMEILPDLLQTRAMTDPEVSRQYAQWMRDGADFPAVVVFLTPDGRFLLADGFHRVDAAKHLGLRAIRARIIHGTMEDAILFGIETNMALKKLNAPNDDDRNHAVEIMIRNETFRLWSNKEIAKRCGVSHPTVAKCRLHLVETSNIPVPDRVICFSHGNPIKGTQPYRDFRGKPDTLPTITNLNSRGFRASINGDKVYLGTDRVKAQSKLQNHIELTASFKEFLKNPSNFTLWMAKRNVVLSGRKNTVLGGFTVGDVFVFRVPDSSQDSILKEIGRATLARCESGDSRRCVLVGNREGLFQSSYFLNIAKRLDPPIEFMTPEEFVAEFAPKNDAEADS